MAITWSKVINDPRWSQQTPEKQALIQSKYFDRYIVKGKKLPEKELFRKWELVFGQSHPAFQQQRQDKLTPTPLEVEKQPEYEFTQPKSLVDRYLSELINSKPLSAVDDIVDATQPISESEKAYLPKDMAIPSHEIESWAKKIKRDETKTEIEKRIVGYEQKLKEIDIFANELSKYNEYIKDGKFVGDENIYNEYQKSYNKYNAALSGYDQESVSRDIEEYNRLSEEEYKNNAEIYKNNPDLFKTLNIKYTNSELFKDMVGAIIPNFVAKFRQIGEGKNVDIVEKPESGGLRPPQVWPNVKKELKDSRQMRKYMAEREIEYARNLNNTLIDKYNSGDRVFPFLPFTQKDFAELPANMTYSIANMGVGLLTGVPTAIVTGSPGLGKITGAAVATLATTRMSQNDFMRNVRDIAIKTYRENGKELTPDEWNIYKKEYEKYALKYGLWESIPETVSNLIGIELFTRLFPAAVGKKIAASLITKIMAVPVQYATEFGTETLTQMGQWNTEIKAAINSGKLREFDNPDDYWESFKEIFPQTFLLTTIMGAGAVASGITAKNIVKLNEAIETKADKKEIEEYLPPDVRQPEKISLETPAEAAKAEVPVETPVKPTEKPVDEQTPEIKGKPPKSEKVNTEPIKLDIKYKGKNLYQNPDGTMFVRGRGNKRETVTLSQLEKFKKRSDASQKAIRNKLENNTFIHEDKLDNMPAVRSVRGITVGKDHSQLSGYIIGKNPVDARPLFNISESDKVNYDDTPLETYKSLTGKQLSSFKQLLERAENELRGSSSPTIDDYFERKWLELSEETRELIESSPNTVLDNSILDDVMFINALDKIDKETQNEIEVQYAGQGKTQDTEEAVLGERKLERPGVEEVGKDTSGKVLSEISAAIKTQKVVVGKLQKRLDKFSARINAKKQESLLGDSEAAQNEIFANTREKELQQLAKIQDELDTEKTKLDKLYHQQNQAKIRAEAKSSGEIFEIPTSENVVAKPYSEIIKSKKISIDNLNDMGKVVFKGRLFQDLKTGDRFTQSHTKDNRGNEQYLLYEKINNNEAKLVGGTTNYLRHVKENLNSVDKIIYGKRVYVPYLPSENVSKQSSSKYNLSKEPSKKPIELGAGAQRETVREEDIFGKETETSEKLNLQLKPLILPYIAKLMKDITGGKVPKIYKKLASGVHGRHIVGTDEIHLLADIFIGERLYTKAFGGVRPSQETIDELLANIKAHFGLSDEQIYHKVFREKGIFKLRFWRIDPDYAARTFGHELFHLIDELPDHSKRGNILGHISTFKNYLKHFLPEKPGAPGELTQKDRSRLKRLAEKMLKDKQFEETVLREIKEEYGIDAKDVLAVWKDIEARDKYPDLYEYIATLSREDKASILKDALKGKVDKVEFKRVVKISTVEEKILRPANAADIKRLYEKLIVDEIKKRHLFQLETIKEELRNLTRTWRPFNPAADAKYTAYRYKNEELYADAGAVLLNNPELIQKIAPNYTRAFFNWLENKPKVKEVYETIQNMIEKGDEEIARYLYEESKRMDLEGEKEEIAKQREEKIGFVNEFLRRFFNKFQYAKMIEKGKKLNPEERVSWALDDTNYIPSIMQQYLREVMAAINRHIKGTDINYHDMSFVAKLLRSAIERKYKGNPLQVSGRDAVTTLEGFRKIKGSDTVDKIIAILNDIQKIRQEIIVKQIIKDGGYDPVLNKYMQDNNNYWTFNVIKYINDKYAKHGGNISSVIFGQQGTLADVENVIYATLAKDYLLLKGMRRRLAIIKTVEFYNKYDPDNIKKAETKFGKVVKINNQHTGTLIYLDEGKLVGYYLPRNIVDAFNTNPTLWYDAQIVLNTLSAPIKALFVNKNLGWAFWNFIYRDPIDTWLKNPEVSLFEVYKSYLSAIPDAFVDVVFNKSTPRVRNYYLRMLIPAMGQWSYTDHGNTTFAEWFMDVIKGRRAESKGKEIEYRSIERLFKRYGIDTAIAENQKNKRFFTILGKTLKAPLWMLSLPSAISEKAGKIGSSALLSDKLGDETLVRHRVRKSGGSPDFNEQGVSSGIPKTLLFFYPAWSAGWTSTIDTAKENPKTFGRKIISSIVLTKLIPWMFKSGIALLILAKIKGCKDDESDEEFKKQLKTLSERGLSIKELPNQKITWLEGKEGENYFTWLYHAYNTISQYDMKNYSCIPIGETPSGKIVYIPVPLGFASQPIAGAVWELLEATIGEAKLSDFIKALNEDFAPGGVNPIFLFMYDLIQMMTGNNPMDFRTGKGKVPESYYGGSWQDNWKHYCKEAWNSYGGGTIYRFKHDELELVQDEIEKMFDKPLLQSIMRRFIRVSDKGLRDKLTSLDEEEDMYNKFANIRAKDYITDLVQDGVYPTENDLIMSYYKVGKDVNERFKVDYSTLVTRDEYLKKAKGFRRNIIYTKANNPLSKAVRLYGVEKTFRLLDKYKTNRVDYKILKELEKNKNSSK